MGVEMARQFTHSGICKPIVGVASAGFAFVTFCRVEGVALQACGLLGNTAWVALAVLRSVILLGDWQGMATYLFEDSRLLQHLLQTGAYIWTIIHLMAGLAK